MYHLPAVAFRNIGLCRRYEDRQRETTKHLKINENDNKWRIASSKKTNTEAYAGGSERFASLESMKTDKAQFRAAKECLEVPRKRWAFRKPVTDLGAERVREKVGELKRGLVRRFFSASSTVQAARAPSGASSKLPKTSSCTQSMRSHNGRSGKLTSIDGHPYGSRQCAVETPASVQLRSNSSAIDVERLPSDEPRGRTQQEEDRTNHVVDLR